MTNPLGKTIVLSKYDLLSLDQPGCVVKDAAFNLVWDHTWGGPTARSYRLIQLLIGQQPHN